MIKGVHILMHISLSQLIICAYGDLPYAYSLNCDSEISLEGNYTDAAAVGGKSSDAIMEVYKPAGVVIMDIL